MVSLTSEREQRVCGVFNEISRDLSMKRDVRESSLKTPQTLRSPSLPSSHLVKRSLPDIFQVSLTCPFLHKIEYLRRGFLSQKMLSQSGFQCE